MRIEAEDILASRVFDDEGDGDDASENGGRAEAAPGEDKDKETGKADA